MGVGWQQWCCVLTMVGYAGMPARCRVTRTWQITVSPPPATVQVALQARVQRAPLPTCPLDAGHFVRWRAWTNTLAQQLMATANRTPINFSTLEETITAHFPGMLALCDLQHSSEFVKPALDFQNLVNVS